MFVFLPIAFASFMGTERNSSINITATSSQKHNCVVPENNHASPMERSQKFGGGVSKYKVLKSLMGWGEGRCLNPTPPKKNPSMEEKWRIPVMKYYINDTEQ